MAVQPPKKKRSPAQVKAGQAFAAAGRAAQARTRAAAIAKTGKPPPASKARHAAAQRWAAAGRAAQAAKRQGKKPVPSKVRGALAPDELALYPGSQWPTGCNDLVPTCASVAVAAHLQAAAGILLPEEEILRLHQLAGGDNGASIENVLEAFKASAFLFGRGRVRLLSFFQTDEQCLVSGLVVGVRLPHAGHAVLSCPGGMISWGRRMPWEGEPEEAWCLEWGV